MPVTFCAYVCSGRSTETPAYLNPARWTTPVQPWSAQRARARSPGRRPSPRRTRCPAGRTPACPLDRSSSTTTSRPRVLQRAHDVRADVAGPAGHQPGHVNVLPVSRSYASTYAGAGPLDDLVGQRRRRARPTHGPSRTPARSASRGRTACRRTAAAWPGSHRSAGQNRDESGVSTSSASTIVPSARAPSSSLVSARMMPRSRAISSALRVDRQGQVRRSSSAAVAADGGGDVVEVDVLVVLAERRLGRRGEDRLGQPRAVDQPGGQRRRRRPRRCARSRPAPSRPGSRARRTRPGTCRSRSQTMARPAHVGGHVESRRRGWAPGRRAGRTTTATAGSGSGPCPGSASAARSRRRRSGRDATISSRPSAVAYRSRTLPL